MPERTDVQRVREQAGRLLAGEGVPPGLAQRQGRLRAPVPVVDGEGRLDSWFVPVTVRGKLVGFLQLLPDLTLMRHSTFQRAPASLEGCPDAAAWLDRKRILERASTMLRPGEQPGRPVLTYDRNPSRLVWAVTATSPKGVRTIFVAGDHVYEGTPGTH